MLLRSKTNKVLDLGSGEALSAFAGTESNPGTTLLRFVQPKRENAKAKMKNEK